MTTSTAVTISATAGGAIRSAQLTVTAVASLSSLSLVPASVRAGATSTATIVLSAPAPPGGVAVSLRSDTTAASVPASASVAAGAASATFVIATNVMAASTSVIISATLGSSTKTAALSLTGLPDFQIASVSAPASAARGRAISVTAQVRNAGAVSAPASIMRFYLSLDGSIDSTDLLVASRDVAALATGASVTLTTTMTIPKTVAPGTYRIIAVIDPTSSVPEQNESNNVRASAPITVLRQAASNVLPNSSQ